MPAWDKTIRDAPLVIFVAALIYMTAAVLPYGLIIHACDQRGAALGLTGPIFLRTRVNARGDSTFVCHADRYPFHYGDPLHCWGGETCMSYETLADVAAGRGVPGPPGIACPSAWVRNSAG